MGIAVGGFVIGNAPAAGEQNRSFDTLARDLCFPYGEDDDNLAKARVSINDAIRYLNRFTFNHQRVIITFTLSASETYEFQADVKGTWMCVQLDANGARSFLYSWAWPVEFENLRNTGRRTYTIMNAERDKLLHILPVPGGAEIGATLQLGVYLRTPLLSGPDEKILAPPEFESLVMEWATYYFVRAMREDNAPRVHEAKARAEESLFQYFAVSGINDDPNAVVTFPN